MRIAIEKIKPSPSRPTYDHERRAWARRRRPRRMPVILAEKGNFYLLSGQSNVDDAKNSGERRIECVVKRGVSELECEELQLADEYFSSLLPPMKLAESFLTFRDKYEVTQQELARRTGITAGTIHHYESLLKTLDPELRCRVDDGGLTFKEARCIADIDGHKRQLELAQPFIESSLSSVHVEELVSKAKANPVKSVAALIKDMLGVDYPSSGSVDETPTERPKQAKKAQVKPLSIADSKMPADRSLEGLQETAFILAGRFEQLASIEIPEYRRLRLISTLRILSSRLETALNHLNGGVAAREAKPKPLAGTSGAPSSHQTARMR